MKRSLTKICPAFLIAVALFGCGGSDSTAPSSPLVGSYNAVQFITTGSSGQTNQILAGSTLSIDLAPNGRTTGHLHMAPSGVNPAFDADMAGTWAQNGSAVTFSQTADTFVRNMTFTVAAGGSSWQLAADQVISGTRIQITLSQVAI